MNSPLEEAPIENFELLGNWDKNSSFRHEQDRKLLSNPKAQAKIIQKWEKTTVPFNLFFVNSPEANRYTEIGKVDKDWLEKEMPKTAAELEGKLREDAINVIFTNNKGSERAPMTAWIIAHRFGHAVSRRNQVYDFTAVNDALETATADIMQHYQTKIFGLRYSTPETDYLRLRRNQPYDYDRLYTNFYAAIGTMKSARDNNLRNSFEFILELLAQYMLIGEIKFNKAPKKFGSTRVGGILLDSNADEVNSMLGTLSRDLGYYFQNLLDNCTGCIFVM